MEPLQHSPSTTRFIWQGDDGSEVLAHFPPADTYNARSPCRSCCKTAREYKDHEHSRTSLLVFGHGDGGGGPTRTMLETLRRARDLQGLPRTRTRRPRSSSPRSRPSEGERPVVVGELYLEYHRGTYTTQARTKRGNRRGELALHDAEFLACRARRRVSARRARPAVEAAAAAAVPRHPPRARRSASSTRTQSATWPRSRPARTRWPATADDAR